MIQGKHIQLRVIEKTDLNTIRQWWNNPNLRGSEGIFFPLTEPQMEKKYQEWLKDKNTFHLVIEKKDQSNILGQITLYRRYGGIGVITPKQDSENKQSTIEAIELGLRYLFMEETNHNCVSLWVPAWNSWLIDIVKEIGMKFAGQLRRTGMQDNEYYDTIVFDMLQSEFLSKTTL